MLDYARLLKLTL